MTYLDPEAIAILERIAQDKPSARHWMPVVSRPIDLVPKPEPLKPGSAELSTLQRHVVGHHRSELGALLRAKFGHELVRSDRGTRMFSDAKDGAGPSRASEPKIDRAALRMRESNEETHESMRFLRTPPSLGTLALAAYRLDPGDVSRVHMANYCLLEHAPKAAIKILEGLLADGESEAIRPYVWTCIAGALCLLTDHEESLKYSERASQLRPHWISPRVHSFVQALHIGADSALAVGRSLEEAVRPGCVSVASMAANVARQRNAPWKKARTVETARAIEHQFSGSAAEVIHAILHNE